MLLAESISATLVRLFFNDWIDSRDVTIFNEPTFRGIRSLLQRFEALSTTSAGGDENMLHKIASSTPVE